MRVLLTGVTSSVAYHLLPIIASGDCFNDQDVDLILCHSEPDNLLDLVEELRECAFVSLHGLSVKRDFCEACKTADVIIHLSPETTTHQQDSRNTTTLVTVACTHLTQIDFSGLGEALHPVNKQETIECSRTARGPLSTAAAIAECLKQIHQEAIEQASNEMMHVTDFQSLCCHESDLYCPPLPVPELCGCLVPGDSKLTHPLLLPRASTAVMLVSVAATNKLNCDISEDLNKLSESFNLCYSKL